MSRARLMENADCTHASELRSVALVVCCAGLLIVVCAVGTQRTAALSTCQQTCASNQMRAEIRLSAASQPGTPPNAMLRPPSDAGGPPGCRSGAGPSERAARRTCTDCGVHRTRQRGVDEFSSGAECAATPVCFCTQAPVQQRTETQSSEME